ncbi:MAG TPA: sugar transferase [Dehalococcoidia bacterium]|jgi:lipopolysaccharide/colanic/teichoic acid biosynthesis glycosyltransferase|nr:sugar transferase [Dehalococcoidia bacterium]
MRNAVTREPELEVVVAPVGVDAVAYRELKGFSYGVKRAFDRMVAAAALVVLAVPMLVIAAVVRLTSPGPAIIGQTRVGRYGRTFTFYKFRSMREDAELLRDDLEGENNHDAPQIFKMRRDPRVTPVGRFLRRTSLDELPNLFNVLKGEMSIIGPRPPLPREVMHYDAHHLQRLSAVPGITGLWQVRGRSELPFEEMVELDLEYIERWSLMFDLIILLRTPLAVFGGRGAW